MLNVAIQNLRDHYIFLNISENELGDKCELPQHCSKSDFQQCKDGRCQCIDRYVSDGSKCLLIARNYLAPCEESVQCSSSVLGGGSTCRNNVCRCKPRYQYEPKTMRCELIACKK